MPTEEQFLREFATPGSFDPLIPWGPDHPSWRGDSYTDYIQSGGIIDSFRNWSQFVFALAFEQPMEGYRFSMELGSQDATQLSPSFPAGEWKLGSVVRIISIHGDQQITQSYKLVTASQQVYEDFAHAATTLDPDSEIPNYGVIAASYALQISDQRGLNMPWDKIGLWMRRSVIRAPLKRQSDMDRGRPGFYGRGNVRSGNGKSQIPWILAAAIAAKVLL